MIPSGTFEMEEGTVSKDVSMWVNVNKHSVYKTTTIMCLSFWRALCRTTELQNKRI